MLDALTTSPLTCRWSRRRPIVYAFGLNRSGRHGAVGLVSVLLPLPGCGVAPSVNVLGSFFPAWLICIVVGVLLTIVSLRMLSALQIATDLGPPGLVYPSLAVLWTFVTWLVVFGS
jgi:hypothetical protein